MNVKDGEGYDRSLVEAYSMIVTSQEKVEKEMKCHKQHLSATLHDIQSA